MMLLNLSQQQLLKQLNIIALEPVAAGAKSIAEPHFSLPAAGPLSDDIQHFLQQLTPVVQWQIAPQSPAAVQLVDDILSSHSVELFKLPHYKRQLWQLLQQHPALQHPANAN